jgi:hypothetical protein
MIMTQSDDAHAAMPSGMSPGRLEHGLRLEKDTAAGHDNNHHGDARINNPFLFLSSFAISASSLFYS